MKSSRTFWALRICLVLKPCDNRKQLRNKEGTLWEPILHLLSHPPCFLLWFSCLRGFPLNSVGKESACNTGDLGSIPGSGRSPREGNGNPLQYSCLENPMDRGAWWATVHVVARVGHNWVTSLSLPLYGKMGFILLRIFLTNKGLQTLCRVFYKQLPWL